MRVLDALDTFKAQISCFQDRIRHAFGRKDSSKTSSTLARTELEFPELFQKTGSLCDDDDDFTKTWYRRHWKLFLVLTIVTVVFLAVGLTVILAIVVPRQIEKLLRTSVLITESTEIANPQENEFTVTVRGQLISTSSVRARISSGDAPISVRQVIQRKNVADGADSSARRLAESARRLAESTDYEKNSSSNPGPSTGSDDWRDPLTFVRPTDRVEDLGTIVFEPYTVVGNDQEITGHLNIQNREQFSSCVKEAIQGHTAWWLLSGTTNVHVAGITFRNIPFNRVFKLTPPSPLDASHLAVTSVDLMEDPAITNSISSEKQKSNLPILIEGQILNTGNLEISDFGSASFDLKYRDVNIGSLHTPHLGFLHGVNPLRLRGFLLPGRELQQIFSNYLHGIPNVVSITVNATDENVLQSALKGLTITQTLPVKPELSASVITHMFLERVQLSPSITKSQYALDPYNRVMLDDGTLSRDRFPTWPQDLVLMTPSKEERRLLKQRVRRYRRVLREDGVKVRKREARQTVWQDMHSHKSLESESIKPLNTEKILESKRALLIPEEQPMTYAVDLTPFGDHPQVHYVAPQKPTPQNPPPQYSNGDPASIQNRLLPYQQRHSQPYLPPQRPVFAPLPQPELFWSPYELPDPFAYSLGDDLRLIEEIYSQIDPAAFEPHPLPLIDDASFFEELFPLGWLEPDDFEPFAVDWDFMNQQRAAYLRRPNAAFQDQIDDFRHAPLRFLQDVTEALINDQVQKSVYNQSPVGGPPVGSTPINNILSAVANVVGSTFGRARQQAESLGNTEENSTAILDQPQGGSNLSFLGDLTKAISSTVLQAVRGGANQGLRTAADLGDMLSSHNSIDGFSDTNELTSSGGGGISITNIGVIKWKEPVSVLIQRACAGMGSSLPIESRVVVGFWSPFYEARLVETQITGELVFSLGRKEFGGNSMIATGKSELIRKGADQYTCEKNLRLHGSKQSSAGDDSTQPNDALVIPQPAHDNPFVLGAVTQVGIIKGQYMMERVNLKSSLSVQPDQLSQLGSQLIEAHRLALELRNMDLTARVALNKEEFEVFENNRTQRLAFTDRNIDPTEHAMEMRVRRLSIPPNTPELTLVVEVTLTLNLPIEIEVESPIYVNWMSQDIVGGPLTIPRLKLRKGPNDVIAYVGFYKDRLAQLVLPMALQMYREGTFNVCITSRSAEEISDEERQVQQKTASVFSESLNIMLSGLVSYCTRVPLGESETRMLGDVFLPFVTQLTKTIHV